MPQSSERRKRARHARKQQEAHWLSQMGPLPDHILRFFAQVEPNTDRRIDRWERAPAHIIDPELGCIDPEKQAELSRHAAHRRTEEAVLRRAELQRDYQHIWGRRGEASTVADEYNEVHPDQPISVRTVQRYFRS